ncbi:Glutathione peroxidase [Forsythia ovata]|uniref:Glutathione peroxidase n=1 Tax=Forsythia ovata TaxID=205694 RepID=A0ABD1SRR5_9LAMI
MEKNNNNTKCPEDGSIRSKGFNAIWDKNSGYTVYNETDLISLYGQYIPGKITYIHYIFYQMSILLGFIEVNGNNAAPLYKFLKLGKWGIFRDDIQWNFAKFLVDKNGQAVDRYYPTTSPLTIEIVEFRTGKLRPMPGQED